MKSPFVGMPDLLPVIPPRGVRLTLAPVEAVALYVCLENAVAALELQQKPGDGLEVLIETLEEIQDRLGDKLDFKARD